MNMRQNMVNGLLAIAGQAADEDSYVPLEWLASTGPACIDSGVRGDNSNLRIEARVKRVGFSNYRYFYGSYLGESYNATRLLLNNTDNGSGWACVNTIAGGGSIAVQGLTNNEWHDIVHTQSSITVDGTTYTKAVSQGTALGNVNIFLFSSQNKYGSVQASTIYMSSFKIYDGNYLLRDFVPKLRLRDSKPGLYDNVTHRFYTNAGTGEFTYVVTGESLLGVLGYVTDGLVECFDGEYNAGTSHTAQSNIWTGMIQNDQLTYEGYDTYTWESKCCHFAGTSGYALFKKSWPYAEEQFVGTIEHCGAWSTITGTGTYPIVLSASYSAAAASMTKASTRGISLVCGVNGWQKNATPTIAANVVTTMAITQTANADYKDYQPYVNASTVAVGYTGSQSALSWSMAIGCGGETSASASGGEGRIYCVRVYNRPLTVAELQQNRAVDVARFGTTV